VVRDLQHIRAQVGPGSDDPCLGRGAQVPREQGPHAALRDPDDQGQVVGRGGCRGPLRGRREHLDRRRPDRPPVSGHQHHPLPTAAPHQGLERLHTFVGGRERAGGDDPDVAPGERPGQTRHMVGVEVGHQDEGQ
jgi:hypothetical protein